MANKKWQIQIDGQPHIIELQTGSFSGGGKLIMDGKEIKKWVTSISGLPSIKFEIHGKKAEIKGKSFISIKPTLYIDGKERGIDSLPDAVKNLHRLGDDSKSDNEVLHESQQLSNSKTKEAVIAHITSRDTQILYYICSGNSNKQIADVLSIHEQTVKNHVSSILRKLNANDRAHAAILAVRNGIIPLENM